MSLSDPLMVALVNKLPPLGSPWPIAERMRWLSAAQAAIDLVYGDGRLVLSKEMSDALDVVARAVASNEAAKMDVAAPKIEAPKAIAPKVEVPAIAPPKNVGGRPSTIRPDGIPTNLAMAIEAIQELGPSSAPQIRNWLRKKHWPGLPDHWTACLYDLVSSGKLKRQGLNFTIVLPDNATRVMVPQPAPAPKPPQTAVTVAKPQPPAPKLAPPARAENTALFEYGGAEVHLNPREYRMAVKLRAAMGKGFLDFKFLVEAALLNERKSGIDNEGWVREMLTVLNPKLYHVGLVVQHISKMGCVMLELKP